MSIVPTQYPRVCSYCHKVIDGPMVAFNGKMFHAITDEHGSKVERPYTCWDKSESGKKAL